jgi:hypothetical protein
MSSLIKIEVTNECAECGNELSMSCSTTHQGVTLLRVDPCKRCMARAEERAEERGYDRGYLEGQERETKTEPAF